MPHIVDYEKRVYISENLILIHRFVVVPFMLYDLIGELMTFHNDPNVEEICKSQLLLNTSRREVSMEQRKSGEGKDQG